MNTLAKTITQLVVNDYFTPNIKAEVILDTLLTPYITQIVKAQLGEQVGELILLTKEMSVLEAGGEDDRGAKIDYVLEDESTVYLVELKMAKGSIDNKQADRYTQNCYNDSRPGTFGSVLGNKLLGILGKKFTSRTAWTTEKLWETFQNLTQDSTGETCEKRAKNYLKQKNLASTHKYLYTVGQILDRHPDNGKSIQELWEKKLKLIYLTPDGSNIIPNKSFAEKQEAWKALYLAPQGLHSSVHLREAVQGLQPGPNDGELVELLQSIITAIYDANI